MKLLKRINWYYTLILTTFLVLQYLLLQLLGLKEFSPRSFQNEIFLIFCCLIFVISISQITLSLFFDYKTLIRDKKEENKVEKTFRVSHFQGFILNDGNLSFSENKIQFRLEGREKGFDFPIEEVKNIRELKGTCSRVFNRRILEIETIKHQKEKFLLQNEYSHFDALAEDKYFNILNLSKNLLICSSNKKELTKEESLTT